ncbi:AraC family transcriptional regulator [Paenibacillus endoradicis]|uniref:AraC family transcriptional regulator n=1 Tax=Paenibacillus endoradicis TaxID=2972487 RepID=UPI0021590E3C|nr:AraC family transcriptional regulator [Paenibacillus endoradicis]MCR8656401.1 AraC family transcriptional regulator [Paenibacillus endoradicis]
MIPAQVQQLDQLLKFTYTFSDMETIYMDANHKMVMAYGPMHIPEPLQYLFEAVRSNILLQTDKNEYHIHVNTTTQQLLYITVFLQLNDQEKGTMIVGPFLQTDPSMIQVQDILFQHQWPLSLLSLIQQYYLSLPLISNEKLNHIIEFIQYIFQHSSLSSKSHVTIESKNYITSNNSLSSPIENIEKKHIVEERYRNENNLIGAVQQGNLSLVEQLLIKDDQPKYPLPDRFPNDPLRSRKNLSFVRNTLLRKATENGGVHPIYIDSISEKFAIQIEKTTSIKQLELLQDNMCLEYCKLVQQLSLSAYSPLIRKALEYIRWHLTDEITLAIVAHEVGINKYELSRSFKKETGLTFPDYIHHIRLKEALQLMNNENLSITDISHMVGYNDVNYFIKVFKKHYEVTPHQYRQ